MSSFTVSSVKGFMSALTKAHAGDTILLAPGTYAGVSISNLAVAGTITIASQSASNPAVLTGLTVSHSSGLTFSGMTFSTVGTVNPSSTTYANPFAILQSQNIQLVGVNVTGSPLSDPATQPNGLLIRGSANVTVTGGQFHYVHAAISELDNTNISISNNSFNFIGNDGIDNAGSSFVQIIGNTFGNFDHLGSTQHPDGIQFWTTGTTASAHDITIANNTLNFQGGTLAQGIFMTDTISTLTGSQVGNLPYYNVNVSNNMVVGALGNGIEINHASNVQISNNDVLTFNNELATYGQVNSRIVLMNTTGALLSGNHADTFITQYDTSVTQSGNTITAMLSPDAVFSSASTTVPLASHSLVLNIGAGALTATANSLGDTIIGNNAGDHLIGGLGNDTLIGGAGNDLIQAGAGSDILTGGGGANSFVFGLRTGQDTITDLNAGVHDFIDISALLKAGNHAILSESHDNAVISFDHSLATITLIGVDYHGLITTLDGFTI